MMCLRALSHELRAKRGPVTNYFYEYTTKTGHQVKTNTHKHSSSKLHAKFSQLKTIFYFRTNFPVHFYQRNLTVKKGVKSRRYLFQAVVSPILFISNHFEINKNDTFSSCLPDRRFKNLFFSEGGNCRNTYTRR